MPLAPVALVVGGSVAISTGVSMGMNAIKQAILDKKEFDFLSLGLDTSFGVATSFIPYLPAGSIPKNALVEAGKTVAKTAIY
jgi:hypothetical protein